MSSPIIAPETLFCGDIVVRGRYGSNVSTVMMGREPSRDLCRHSSSFVCHVTSLWRLPCCFAAMLFCDDTVTRGAPSCFDFDLVNPNTNPDPNSKRTCSKIGYDDSGGSD